MRRQEELAERWRALDRAIVAASARPPAERVPEAEQALKGETASVKAELDAITAEVTERFPDYAALVSPAPVPITEIQSLLAPDEALLAMLLVEDALYLWLIGRERVEWQRVGLEKGRLAADVARLRAELDPGQGGGAHRQFEAALAHELYRRLFPFDLPRRSKACATSLWPRTGRWRACRSTSW